MATDIYNANTRANEAWTVDGVVISISNAEDLTITSLNFQYPRSMIQVKPLNKAVTVTVTGEGRGTISLGAILGPRAAIKEFLDKYADACNIASNVITMRPSGPVTCDGVSESVLEFIFSNCLLSSITGSIQQSGDLATFAAGLSLSFTGLKVE